MTQTVSDNFEEFDIFEQNLPINNQKGVGLNQKSSNPLIREDYLFSECTIFSDCRVESSRVAAACAIVTERRC